MAEDRLVLFDTSVLVYAAFEDDPLYQAAQQVQAKAINGGIRACLSAQNLTELYAIVTDSKRVSKPLTAEEGKRLVESYLRAEWIKKIYFRSSTVVKMMELVQRYKIPRQHIFDAQLVATMLDNGVRTIYTAEDKDFRIFEGIVVVNPFLAVATLS